MRRTLPIATVGGAGLVATVSMGVQAANSTGWTTKELHRQRKLLEAQRDAFMDKQDREADDDDEDEDEEDDGAAPLPCLLARACRTGPASE